MDAISSPLDPVDIWRTLCFVDDRLAVCGDLPTHPVTGAMTDEALDQLRVWQEAGITHIIDVRVEHSDESFVARYAPTIDYTWLGTHDEGGAQGDEWWESGLAAVERARRDGDRTVVHCHMGVNRAPSLVYRVLLADGLGSIDAFDRVRTARPIAAIAYAPSALDHHHRTIGSSESTRIADIRGLREYMNATAVDSLWIRSNIRRAGG